MGFSGMCARQSLQVSHAVVVWQGPGVSPPPQLTDGTPLDSLLGRPRFFLVPRRLGVGNLPAVTRVRSPRPTPATLAAAVFDSTTDSDWFLAFFSLFLGGMSRGLLLVSWGW